MSTVRRWVRGAATGAALLALVAACNAVVTSPVHRNLVAPELTGISIPVPPPSLWAAPVQDADVEGEILLDEFVRRARVFLHEQVGDRGYFEDLPDDGLFSFSGIRLDLADNCIVVHVEGLDAEGAVVESERGHFRAVIGEDDRTVELEPVEGCE